MKQLWAPWRMKYIKSEKNGECAFCILPEENRDEDNLILYRAENCFIIMNTYPYSNGHLMVCPFRHLDCLTKLSSKETEESWNLIRKCIEILRSNYNAEGFNVGLNLGKAGGAGFDQHVHFHIVPRWTGDTNYMPVLADVKVQPEHLRAGYEKLQPLFQIISL
tara:strand:- start:478 stop:966 length:489 start_codon:yes stop_codon:yes gene_type:complete